MTSRWRRLADTLARYGLVLLLTVIATSVLLGLLAALAGGRLVALGEGPGGAWGVPDLLLLVVIALGVPSLVFGLVDPPRGEQGGWVRGLAFFGPLAVALGYFAVAHLLDPCLRGAWGAFSEVAGVRLCERFGLELNVHTRFHLLLHAATGVPFAALYLWALRRWHPRALFVRPAS